MSERVIAGIGCAEVLELLSEYVDGELKAAKAAQIEAHLLGCPNCEQFGRNFGSMVVSLRQAPKDAAPVDFGVLERMLRQLREMGDPS